MLVSQGRHTRGADADVGTKGFERPRTSSFRGANGVCTECTRKWLRERKGGTHKHSRGYGAKSLFGMFLKEEVWQGNRDEKLEQVSAAQVY